MIAENELRIGNWIFQDKLPIELTRNRFKLAVFTIRLDGCEAIPLTPDLFRKAGFVWDSFFDGYVQGKILIKKIRRKYQVYWHLNQLTRIQYVHELQNLWHSIHHTDLTL